MEEIKTDYLALARQHTRSDNTELLQSIAYSLIDLAQSARVDASLATALGLVGEYNHELRQRIEELEAALKEKRNEQ